MIHRDFNHRPITPVSPLRALAPRPAAPAVPQDGWSGSAAPATSAGRPTGTASSLQRAEVNSEHGRVTGMKVALGLTGLAAAGLGMLSAAPAQAQVRLQATPARRDTQPVRANSAADVVRQFDASRPIYVIGDPQFRGQSLGSDGYRELQNVMKKHPHSFVVLVAQSDDVKGDDATLSRGIGNSSAFKSLGNPETGEPDGNVIMVYFKVTDQKFVDTTGKDRAIYMRSEQLLDDARVGENDFLDRFTLTPGKLMNAYTGVVGNGGTVPAALGAVLDQVDAGVETHLRDGVRAAQATVDQAAGKFEQVSAQAQAFKREHGAGGKLGAAPVESWQGKLAEARSELKAHHYARASELARSLQNELGLYTDALNAWSAGPIQAQQIAAELEKVQNDAAISIGPAASHLDKARASLAAYQQLHDAQETGFAGHLKSAASEVQLARESLTETRASAAAVRNMKIYGSAAVGAALLVTTALLAMRANKSRKQAQGELDAALGRMAERSKAVIDVMNQSDVAQMAAFTGTTQKTAQALMASTAEALALMGGADKVLDEARGLIAGTSVGTRLKNLLTTSSFENAVQLLTDPNRQVPFELKDAASLPLEAGSRADAWRQHLLAGTVSKPAQQCFLQMLDQLGKLAKSNGENTELLLRESRQVGAYLDSVRDRGKQARQASEQLVSAGQADGLFTAPSIGLRLLPAVDETVDHGHAVKGSDPFRARQEFGAAGERMLDDADQILETGHYGRSSTLPKLNQADERLQAHEIDTGWAHAAAEELSLALDRSGEAAVRNEVAPQVQALKLKLVALESRLASVVDLDEQRWNTAAPRLKAAEEEVARARQELCQALQSAGVFQNGTPDRVLRESDRDPDASIYQARQHYTAVKPLLDVGDVQQPPAHLDAVTVHSGAALTLVSDSRQALAAYPTDSQERRTRRAGQLAAIDATYSPSLGRLSSRFSEHAQRAVVPEVSAADTTPARIVSDFLASSQGLLDRTARLSDKARQDYEAAQLLTARDGLSKADALLGESQKDLAAIVSAERLLGQHQSSAEAELKSLGQRLADTEGRAGAVYVRQPARQALKQTQSSHQALPPVVEQQPASPYEARAAVSASEALRMATEALIDGDHRAFDAANTAVSFSYSLIDTAAAEIEKAARTGWQQIVPGYGQVEHSVDGGQLATARATLDSARSALKQAEARLPAQAYEQAKADAEGADRVTQTSRQQTQSVVDAAEAVFRDKVSGAQAVAQAAARLSDATESVNRAAGQSWSQFVSDYGQVSYSMQFSDLAPARAELDSASRNLSAARSSMSSDRFEEARRNSSAAERDAAQAVASAQEAVRRGAAIFQAQLAEAQACVAAKAGIREAQSDVGRAESEVSEAGRQSWSQYVNGYGNVSHAVTSSDLSAAFSYLNQARSSLNSAQSALSGRDYSSARSYAQGASSAASSAASEARSTVSREQAEFQRKVRQAEDSVVQPPSSGGGGGGSTGGGVGGGNSGSSGGGW